MALEDFIHELPSHQLADLVHFRVTKPGIITNAIAISILEGSEFLNRTMTSQELGWLGELVSGLSAGDFSIRDFEAAARLFEKGITKAQFLALLGF